MYGILVTFSYKFGVPKADMKCHDNFVKRTKKTYTQSWGLGKRLLKQYWLI